MALIDPILLLLTVLVVFFLLTYWPTDPFKRLHQSASAALQQCNYERAATHYRELLTLVEKQPQSAKRDEWEFIATQGLGVSLSPLHRYAEAQPQLERATELLDNGVKCESFVTIPTWCTLAFCAAMQRETNQQLSDIETCALERIESLLAEMRPTNQETALHDIRQYGQQALANDRIQLAEQLCHISLACLDQSDLPDEDLTVLLNLDLAHCHQLVGDTEQASELIRNTVDNNYVDLEDTTLLHMWHVLGNDAALQGDLPKAIECRQRTLEYQETTTDVATIAWSKINLSDALHRYGDYEKAIALAIETDQQLKYAPRFPEWFPEVNLASSLLIQGAYERVDEILWRAEKHAREFPQHMKELLPTALNYRAAFFCDLRLKKEAIDASKEAIAYCEANAPLRIVRAPEIHGRLSLAQYQADAYQTAESTEQLQRAKACMNESPPAGFDTKACYWLVNSRIAIAQRDGQRALTYLSKAEDLLHDRVLPSHALCHGLRRTRGVAEASLGNHTDAITIFAECAESMNCTYHANHPHRAWLHDYWSSSLKALGRTAEADEHEAKAEAIFDQYAELAEKARSRSSSY